MTIFSWDVPGYIQGHRFSSESRYWDGSRFRDLAGYNHLNNHVQLVAGTPAFSTHGANNRIGLLLNNATTFKFFPSVPWEGSMLFVLKPTITASAAPTQYPWLFGSSSSVTSNGNIRLTKSVPTVNLTASTPSGFLLSSLTGLVNGAIAICSYSFNQTDRIARNTRDGVTISASAVEPGTDGDPVAIGAVGAPGVIPDIGGISHDYVRMGDMVGDGALVPNAADYLHVFEQHFWKGDVLLNNATQLAAFIASLKTYYGI